MKILGERGVTKQRDKKTSFSKVNILLNIMQVGEAETESTAENKDLKIL